MFSKAPATKQRARISGLLLIALVTLFADAASAAQISVLNGTQFTTTTGTPIQAHGGGVIKVGPYYYWFGENRNPNSTFFAVSCYRSTDLKNWEFRNNVLTANSAAELNPANIERPKVVF
ncbi:MAG TPA: beta-xylosidase, partial [Blastocatellia bacterium]|nr:beta-xylosidase [Blastocatellia bacterium]